MATPALPPQWKATVSARAVVMGVTSPQAHESVPVCNTTLLPAESPIVPQVGPLAAGNHSGQSRTAMPGCGPTLLPAGGSPAPRTNPPTAEMQERASPLTLRSKWWVGVTASGWVVRAITKGYRLQFASMPPHFAGIIHSLAPGESASVLQEDISDTFTGQSELV